MKKSYTYFIIIHTVLLLAAFTSSVSAKTSPADLVKGFPAKAVLQENTMCINILKQGSPAITAICQMLQPPKNGGDVKVRYAIGSLTQYAGRPGGDADRKIVVDAYLKVLNSDVDGRVKFFLIKQLQLIGGAESIKPLGVLLTDDLLGKPAVRALEAIGGDGVEAQLIKVLSNRGVIPGNRMAVIHALGNMQSAKAAKLIMAYAESKDVKLKKTAQAALANIGEPSAQNILAKAALTGTPYAKAKATSNYLLFAKRLVKNGHKNKATKICREVIKNRNTLADKNIPSAALSLLVDIEGKGAMPDMLTAMDTPNDQLHATALRLAGKYDGTDITRQWIKKGKAVGPDVQVKIIAMLGERNEKIAQDELVAQAHNSQNKNVRIASYAALAKFKGSKSIDVLVDALKTDQADEVAAIIIALKQLPAKEVHNTAANKFSTLSSKGQVAVMQLYGDRSVNDQKTLVLKCAATNSVKAVKLAAYKTLKRVATTDDIKAIVTMMLKAKDAQERKTAAKVAVSLMKEISDPQRRADHLLEALKNSSYMDDKVLLFSFLPQAGGDKALAEVVKTTKSDDSKLRDTAIRALAKWKDAAAAKPTIELASSVKELNYHVLLMRNFIQVVPPSNISAIDKINGYNKALEIARRPDEKKLISIRKSELIATFNKPPKGFVALFNGKDLTGWKGLLAKPNDDPIKRAKLSPEKLSQEQAKANGNLKAHWSVKDGILMFDGKGFSCVADRDYKDFEMLVDWKIVNPKGDSGIYLRGAPQVQIWDPAQHKIGSGGLYNNKKNLSKPLVTADNPIGTWNTFRIKMIGERVTVYLNGQLVVDNVILENYWNRNITIDPSGQIELQCHGDPIHFRNIYIREIHNTLSEKEKADGFKLLFNGKDHTGWIGHTKGYIVQDGKFKCTGGGNMCTKEKFANFTLRFDFKLVKGANNGLAIRTPHWWSNAAFAAMELQILDNTAEKHAEKIKDWQRHGSIYGVYAAYSGKPGNRLGHQKPIGQWNHQEVIAKGDLIRVVLNGKAIVPHPDDQKYKSFVNIRELAENGTIDGKPHTGLKKNKTGHIGFLGHGTPVEFRNIRIKKH